MTAKCGGEVAYIRISGESGDLGNRCPRAGRLTPEEALRRDLEPMADQEAVDRRTRVRTKQPAGVPVAQMDLCGDVPDRDRPVVVVLQVAHHRPGQLFLA